MSVIFTCCGTRAEAGGSAIVLDEINNYGRKGRIFMVHLRNVRGSLATAGAFEEVLLGRWRYECFQKSSVNSKKSDLTDASTPITIPKLEGDVGLAYSVGYIKALFAALAA